MSSQGCFKESWVVLTLLRGCSLHIQRLIKHRVTAPDEISSRPRCTLFRIRTVSLTDGVGALICHPTTFSFFFYLTLLYYFLFFSLIHLHLFIFTAWLQGRIDRVGVKVSQSFPLDFWSTKESTLALGWTPFITFIFLHFSMSLLCSFHGSHLHLFVCLQPLFFIFIHWHTRKR